jgi:hypothetical protein
VKWSASEKGQLCSATKLLNNVSDNITLDDLNLATTILVYKYCPQYSYKKIYEYCKKKNLKRKNIVIINVEIK